MSAAAMVEALHGTAFTYRDEDQLQEGLAAHLAGAGFTVEREVRLSAADRLDLLVGRCVVEVKIKGTADRLLAQLRRYAASDSVDELLVVTTRRAHRSLPSSVGGKRCVVHHLGGAR